VTFSAHAVFLISSSKITRYNNSHRANQENNQKISCFIERILISGVVISSGALYWESDGGIEKCKPPGSYPAMRSNEQPQLRLGHSFSRCRRNVASSAVNFSHIKDHTVDLAAVQQASAAAESAEENTDLLIVQRRRYPFCKIEILRSRMFVFTSFPWRDQHRIQY
jgi:plasmid stabilization system protein ParE